ncbi:MAG: hypothetical protein P8074_13235 [Anaerolineales bacterium]
MKNSLIIQTIELCKTYGMGDIQVKALQAVNLEIHAGEFVAILSACGGASTSLSDQSSSATGLSADYENALSAEMQLAVGTLMLYGTENEVDPATAAQLVTLWKAARSLSESDSAAQAEIDALYKQIEETMTPARMQAISGMQITRQDMTQVFQDLGLETGNFAGRFGTLTPEMQATAEAARESGQFPGGGAGFPGFEGGAPGGGFAGGGAPPGGIPGEGFPGGPGAAANANGDNTDQADRNRGSGLMGPLYDALIQYLEGKTG